MGLGFCTGCVHNSQSHRRVWAAVAALGIIPPRTSTALSMMLFCILAAGVLFLQCCSYGAVSSYGAVLTMRPRMLVFRQGWKQRLCVGRGWCPQTYNNKKEESWCVCCACTHPAHTVPCVVNATSPPPLGVTWAPCFTHGEVPNPAWLVLLNAWVVELCCVSSVTWGMQELGWREGRCCAWGGFTPVTRHFLLLLAAAAAGFTCAVCRQHFSSKVCLVFGLCVGTLVSGPNAGQSSKPASRWCASI